VIVVAVVVGVCVCCVHCVLLEPELVPCSLDFGRGHCFTGLV